MPVKIAYIDSSPLMDKLLTELPALEALTIFDENSAVPLAEKIAGAAIVLNGHTAMPRNVIEASAELKSIVFLGTGASSYIDLDHAASLGIRVRTIRGYGDRTIAEHAFALMLAASRQIAAMDRSVRAGGWTIRPGLELKGSTLGILGVGGVGREMANLASSFGMRVLAWNRSPIAAGATLAHADLDTVLAQSDVISIHLALTPETTGLLDTDKIRIMKPGVIVVNTARGAIFDEPALIAALCEGRIGHAALDVFAVEPLPARHPLTKLDNVTLTAHSAWQSEAACRRLLADAITLAKADAAHIAVRQSLTERI